MTIRSINKGLNVTLTVCGVEQRFFLLVALLAGCVWLCAHRGLLAVGLFAIGWLAGYIQTRLDPKFIDSWARVFKVKCFYDPAKYKPFSVRVTK